MSAKKNSKFFLIAILFVMLLSIPSLLMAHPAVTLLDKDGNAIKDQLSSSDTITAANGTIYKAGPAYSPKQTCGKCHDYNAVTKAYHFRTGAGPNADETNIDDLWVSKNKDNNTLQKYLTHAYGHLESGGQYGAW